MDTPHRETTPSRYFGRHRPPLLTRTVFAALATATVLGTGLTAASAAPIPEDVRTVAEAPASQDGASPPSKEPKPAPSKEKPSSPETVEPPQGNDAEKKKKEEETKEKPKPSWVVPSHDAISDTFGPRGWRGGEMHNGLDFAAEQGDPNFAAAAGTVTQAGPNGGYGTMVVIDHGDGVETWYGHHSQLSVSVGDKVQPGEKIGLAGSTGDITGPHLHFEVHVNGKPVDPYQFLTDKGVNL